MKVNPNQNQNQQPNQGADDARNQPQIIIVPVSSDDEFGCYQFGILFLENA